MRSAEPAETARQLRRALCLWRGRPLADVAGVAWLEEQAERLDLLRLRVRRRWLEARLAAGEHAQLVPELEEMAVGHPFDDGSMSSSCWRCTAVAGRQTPSRLPPVAGTLDEELGIGPGQALRDLETAILQQDPALDAPVPAGVPAAPQAPVPAQLPPAVPAFTGRNAELASLDVLAGCAAVVAPTVPAGPAAPAAMTICAVSGTAGVGKTALAVHWAHRVAGRFPDGQLYVNLRGFGPAGTALDPGQALSGFLDALGVPAARIPADPDTRAGLYRTLLAGKRVLVVLDNARSADQVRPLLPGSPGCLAIVTSRDQFAGLVATEGARRCRLTCSPLPTPGSSSPGAWARHGSLPSRKRSATSSPPVPGSRWRSPSPPPAPPPVRASRLPPSPPNWARQAAPWIRSTAVTTPPTCGRCSPGPTAP